MHGTVGRIGALRLALFKALLVSSAGALAQQAPSPPSRPEITPTVPDRDSRPGRVRVQDNRALAQEECPLATSDVQVDIDRILFTRPDGQPLAPGVLDALARVTPPEGGAGPVSVVCEIRDRANSALRQAGYIATVQIPPQTITSGELQLHVVTARIVEVRFRGDAPPYRDTIAARAEQLKALDPLNERDAERILLLAGDIPGLDVQMALQPAGTAPGEVIGELTVNYRPWSILGNVNNFGSRQLGRESIYLRGELYGLTGAADVTYVGASTTFDFEEQRVLQVGHMMGIGDGTTLEGSFLYAWSRPDVGLLDLRSESYVGSIVAGHPLRRSRRQEMAAFAGFEVIEQRTRIFAGGNPQPLNRDRLRVAFARLDAEFRGYRDGGDLAHALATSLEVRQGLDIFGATETGTFSSGYTPSRFSGDASALVVRGNVEGEVALNRTFSIAGRALGQWANNPLLNFEEFSIGNLTIGRGYDPGANSADRAIGLRAEARARVYRTRDIDVALFGFYDSVWLWNIDPNAIENDRRLGSYGGGVRALVAGTALIEAMYARPEHAALLIPGAVRAPDRLLVSVTFQFPRGGR